ncbi:MAG: ketol-acid reductoisomerase [Candidatus Levybacteria bacterium]|nr:ketol-acid reductoisomerase [Candidatus Levybacteria bacterium]
MAKMNFGGVTEEVVTRKEFPLSKAKQVLKDEVIAVIGYGVQGPAQALNLRDNGFNVIVGQRKGGKSFEKAKKDGWMEGKTLFEIEEAVKRGTIICYLLSDAGQIQSWPLIKKHLTSGKALCFSHGFGITYKKHTKIIPPENVDVILVAPKGAGRTVRKHFLEGKGINSSFAIFQDATKKAMKRVLAMGIGIGSGYLFETTFEKEVFSDLTGERGVLMGAIAGIMEAQYNLLRKKGHSPSESFNETVEEATQSLIPLISENGMDWMFANTSTTAQRGALDWKEKFKKAVEPVFAELYARVKSGKEAEVVIKANSKKDYKQKLQKELDKMKNSEMWQTGAQVRSLRPEKQK